MSQYERIKTGTSQNLLNEKESEKGLIQMKSNFIHITVFLHKINCKVLHKTSALFALLAQIQKTSPCMLDAINLYTYVKTKKSKLKLRL